MTCLKSSSTPALFEFEYATFGSRVVKRRTPPNQVTATIDKLFEARRQGSRKECRFKIQLPGPTSVEIIDTKTGSQAALREFYLPTDQIGSVRTISTNGPRIERLAYDPFGRRNNPSIPDQPGTPPASGIAKGFAGHDHDDELALVNMREQIYDPAVCHLLTPDTSLRDISIGKNLNPYAYALKNPATFRDPTGYDAEDDDDGDQDEDVKKRTGDAGSDDESAADEPVPSQATAEGVRPTSDNAVDAPLNAVWGTWNTPEGPVEGWIFEGITFDAPKVTPSTSSPVVPAPAPSPPPDPAVQDPDLSWTSAVANAFSRILGLLGTDWGGGPISALQVVQTAHLPAIGESTGIAVEFVSPVTLERVGWLTKEIRVVGRLTNAGRALTWAAALQALAAC